MSVSGRGGPFQILLTIPNNLAPLTLAFAIHVTPPEALARGGAQPRYITPVAGPHFAELIGMQAGQAEPLGERHTCLVGVLYLSTTVLPGE